MGVPRRPARDVIDAILDNMRQNLEVLKYSTLAPSRYIVYLHPDEYSRMEGIFPILQEETARALTAELDALNRRSSMLRRMDRLLRRTGPPVHKSGGEWQIEFFRDPDGEVAPGDIVVDSQLVIPGRPELGVGERTRRVTTRPGDRTSVREEPLRPATAAVAAILARLTYEDNSGAHTFDITRDSVTVGRGGIAYHVDVRVQASADVSREHLRIRHDAATNRFFVIDLSSLGTTLNGRRLPKGYEEADGTKRENGVETQLPDTARIGMADTVHLDFQKLTR
jgi:hypothetical protein